VHLPDTSGHCEAVDRLLENLRCACAEVASRARHVRIDEQQISGYAASLPPEAPPRTQIAEVDDQQREQTAAFWLTLAAINFGSGWFPTLRKQPGRSGYDTISSGLQRRFDAAGPWSAAELTQIDEAQLAQVTGQDPEHELIGLYATSLRDLGANLVEEFGGSFWAPVRQAECSAPALVELLARWNCFEDVSRYGELELWFLKRAQLGCADLARANIAPFRDVARLTMFADNLVPHVLRLDGILSFDAGLAGRIERGELLEHDSPEEVEIRACALHAVELIVSARSASSAAGVDELLWNRGREPRYKASPRHRSHCTAY
jgi:putative queuosine salvage protein